MKKFIKIALFSLILCIGIGVVIFKDEFNLGENVYVVSKSEGMNKESTTSSNKDIDKGKDLDKANNIDIKRSSEKMITVYVSGAINKPGVVTIENGKRLSDAVEELGGVTSDADLNKINMALKISDEEHYIIPKIGEEIEVSNGDNLKEENSNKANPQKETQNKVNINSATIEDLDELPGIGEATANKIINYREENKKFKSIEEIKNVNGIGEKKYENIKDLIIVN